MENHPLELSAQAFPEPLSGIKPCDKYTLFRETFPEFIYESFAAEETETEIRLTFTFRVPGLASFAPTWTLPKPASMRVSLSDGAMRRLIFSLGLVELVSYWKIACPPKVKIRCGTIGKE